MVLSELTSKNANSTVSGERTDETYLQDIDEKITQNTLEEDIEIALNKHTYNLNNTMRIKRRHEKGVCSDVSTKQIAKFLVEQLEDAAVYIRNVPETIIIAGE